MMGNEGRDAIGDVCGVVLLESEELRRVSKNGGGAKDGRL